MNWPVVGSYQFFDIREERREGLKTAVYHVVSRATGDGLGVISWYGPWRQYCFFPGDVTVWSDGCLAGIRDFLGRLKLERIVK